MADIPPWLAVMKTLTGTKEVPGAEANPVITGMTTEIARIWEDVPGMKAYCDQPAWDSDETAWCGVAAGYCLSEAGFMPPFGATDTDRFGWAKSWSADPNYVQLSTPVPGAIVVMTRDGGGHVTLFEEDAGSNIKCRGGNQSNSVNLSSYAKSSVLGYFWPKAAPLPPQPRRMLKKGSTGADVAALQTTLGVYPADGDFGSITDSAVKGYQAACSLEVDGIVGDQTWAKLDDLDEKVEDGGDGLGTETISAIMDVAANSAIASYSWKDRGKAPLGYIQGMALCFALALDRLNSEDDAAWEMAKANTGDEAKDVFAWYEDEFDDEGMDNGDDVEASERLRHLFVLMIGLGMRESSGRYPEGRDQSASNVSADTAEAGMFQTSWNIRSCNGNIPPLLTQYWENPCGFRDQFKMGVTLKSSDLGNFGSGGGAQYQFLSKFAPSFHALVTAIGLRNLRQHWGPVNRYEVELKGEADAMLQAVQSLVDSGVEPGPGPDPGQPWVAIEADGSVSVESSGGVYVTVNGERI
jgi:uncharacterized protein (TIGR02594 family)